jgi:sugar lactone lactonase YvrE
MLKKILIFSIGFLCAWIIFSIGLKKGVCQMNIPENVYFSGDSTNLYFFDRDEARIYKYNTQGKLTRTYTVKELGKDLILK